MVTREFFRRWGEYRQLIRELKSYSDVELAELGMVRSACARTAFDAAFGSALEDLRRWLRSGGARSVRENHSSSAGSASADRICE
jgi:DNA-directed RNA polymerase subunit N (RpoN/RPB10)